MNLSKSLYARAIQCPKSLWLKKYNPSVLTPQDALAKAVFETGNAVGELACELFPKYRGDANATGYTDRYNLVESHVINFKPKTL